MKDKSREKMTNVDSKAKSAVMQPKYRMRVVETETRKHCSNGTHKLSSREIEDEMYYSGDED